MFVENENIEWKEKWKDDYLKQICSFANTKGGLLYIGVNDNGKVVGIKDAPEQMNIISQKIRAFLGIKAESNLKRKKNLNYIVVKVEKQDFPISYKGKYYLRSGSSTYEATGLELDRIILSRIGKRWEEHEIEGLRIEEISKTAINKFKEEAIKSGKFTEEELNIETGLLLKKLKLYSKKGLNYAGMLLFGNNPENYIKSSTIRLALFAYDNLCLIKQDEISGPIILQLDKTLSLLYDKYLKEIGLYDGKENKIIPYLAMKELLLNAVEHKAYDMPAPIEIKVYKNKITIWNPVYNGDEININDFYSPHAALPSNPLIAETFYKCGLASSWGLGIEKVKNISMKAQTPLPKFRTVSTGLMARCNAKSEYLKALKMRVPDMDKDYLLRQILNNPDITTDDLQKVLSLKQK